MNRKKHVAILMGGWSAERKISLRSGAACAQALKDSIYRISEIDVDRSIATTLAKLRPDVALNMLHGPFGEDGCIQGVLEILKIPYTHSGVLSSALAMNKAMAREVFRDAGIPIAEGKVVSRKAAAKNPLPMPYVIKPIADGSSVGVSIVQKRSDVPKELTSKEWKYGEEVLVEKFIPGLELTCAVLGDKALGVIEISSDRGFYDYDAKYAPGGSSHILPARIPKKIYSRVQDLSLRAHRALGCRGVSRSDFRYDKKTNTLVCLETNTQPGMTATSLVPELAAHAGIPFPKLVEWMIEDASCNR